MQSAPFLELRVTHEFYSDGRCPDFAITPTRVTERLMRRLRVICKRFEDRVALFAEVDQKGIPLAARAATAAPLTLQLLLRPRSDAFALFTDLAPIAAQIAPLFTNVSPPATDPVHLGLTSRVERRIETLIVHSPSVDDAFVLAGKLLPGVTEAAPKIETAGFEGAIKRVDPDSKRVLVNTSAAAPGTSFDLSYPVWPERPSEVFAEVELVLDSALLRVSAPARRTFVVPLLACASRWCFYLVTDYRGDVSALRLVDATPGDETRGVTFADTGPFDLSQTPDSADAIGLDLGRRNPGRRILRFLSDSPVRCRETPVRNLELHMADTRLITALPNPLPQNFAAFRTAADPATLEKVLYQVLTLVAN